MPFGCRIARVEDAKYACNLFAVPLVADAPARWAAALDYARAEVGER